MSEARQIQSMIDFIEREAQEKADELNSAAQEEYDVEKMRLVEAEKVKVRANNEQKLKQVDVGRRVARANFSKAQRLRIMEAQSNIVEQLKENIKTKLMAFVKNTDSYKKLLVSILHEALSAVRTDAIVYTCKNDEPIVTGMLSELEQWYLKTVGTRVSIRMGKEYLNAEEALGGVVVKSHDGHIVCNWTLSSRMRNCVNDQLPTIRYYLFNPESSI
ncbi:ATP synthase, putative [Trypanosoma brucei gambiense DAL972]|uniref:ATP synthase, putative n=3 Tax=Trypanosoma brucei TaxID=5691 RepID=Q383Y7_TRYB2|nr:ATP synthase, putative [Trypanosoma brucei gambiense DAL972]XP_829006.1 ATP synthase, putative [Trypanosoma brucei brucei TREU927]EAN79894.1 ATP synthase, putative [Trypanosoma brucei brucei TREU927]RHW67937.1 ATP synthase [Trypanosoma brucei equiperdum]CBH17938.1 ATP synthase, putative [Trypanosoma brucei gambiense DAL972]|eukprot:XP_011780202.1 ATP synthase, putative [Trypanosoma brucei gambiense DAL972]